MYVIKNKVSGKYWSILPDAAGVHTCWTNDLKRAIILQNKYPLNVSANEEYVEVECVFREVNHAHS